MKIRGMQRKVLAFICMLIILVPYIGKIVGDSGESVYAAGQNGKINADLVNVRVGAGTGNDYVRDASGNKIQLNSNFQVAILGTTSASDGALWYNISFYHNGIAYTGYVHGEFVNVINSVEYTEDTDFEQYLTEQGFPESYKDGLRNLHAQYPKWTFVADHINFDWNEVVVNESLIGRSLIHTTAISSWKSTEPAAYDYSSGTWYGFDGASWVAASEDLVAYCLDPRNFLDSSSIFQFEKLAYDATLHSLDGVQSIVTSTFMENTVISNDLGGEITYAQAILGASGITGVSPYHLTSRIIQEIGVNGGSASISGAVPGYESLYNYYNQGAYAHDGRSAITNGLIYARNNGWTTRYKAIVGGAEYIGKNYINAGQNTLYYEKFDFIGTPYTHQYMTNVLAPSSESANVAKGYTEDMRKNLNLVFVIPVYKNMPQTACPIPAGDGSPNNVLSKLIVDGYNLTPTFSRFTYEYDLIVGKDAQSVSITTETLDPSAKVTGTGNITLNEGNNIVDIHVTAVNGDVRIYRLNIYRGDISVLPNVPVMPSEPVIPENPESPDNVDTTGYMITTEYAVDETAKIITEVTPGTTVADALAKITTSEGEAYILNADGTINANLVSTGNQLLCVDKNGQEVKRYTFIIYGDVDGDGDITSLDLLYIKRHVLGIKELSGYYLMAGDTNRANDSVTSIDLLYVKRHILAITPIVQ